MKYAATCLWITLVVFMIFGTFIMKNRVQDLEKELVRINAAIKEDIKTIHILKAEWSHLNNPERLRSLANRHASLSPVKAEQIIDYASLPFEYESNDAERRMLARQNLKQTRELRQLARAQR